MANDSNKNEKDKKRFFKDFKAELKKVIWPTPKQIVNNTIAVITIVIITAIIVLVLDLAFEALNTYGINKLKNVVSSNEITDGEIEESDSNEIDLNSLETEEDTLQPFDVESEDTDDQTNAY